MWSWTHRHSRSHRDLVAPRPTLHGSSSLSPACVPIPAGRHLGEPEMAMRSPDKKRDDLNEDICVHIFSTSAAMLGVCMTVVGVLHVVVMRNVDTIADDLLSIDAMIYLLA